MSCDHRFITENLTDLIEGRLSPAMNDQCREVLDRCRDCRETYRNTQALYKLAGDWRDFNVPDWHRTRYAVRPRPRQGLWLNAAAMAMSLCAMLMVVLRLEISVDNGLLISFGGTQSSDATSELIAGQLEAFRQDQALLLDTRLAEYANDRDIATRLLLADWMETSREERRSDLDLLLTSWESQRFRDQRAIDQRFDYLTISQLESDQFINSLMRNANFTTRGNP